MIVHFDLVVKASGLIKQLQDEPKRKVMNDCVYNQTYLMLVYSMLNTFGIIHEAKYNEDNSIKKIIIYPNL